MSDGASARYMPSTTPWADGFYNLNYSSTKWLYMSWSLTKIGRDPI